MYCGFFLSFMMTLLCIPASKQVDGNSCFLSGYFSSQQEWNIIFNRFICSFIYRLFLNFQMDGSFSELINLLRVFNKIIVVTIAQDKLFKSFFSQENIAVYGKTSKKSIIMPKIYQIHIKITWFHLDDRYLKEFKWHQNR